MSATTTQSPHWVVGIDVGVKSAHKVAIFDRRTGKRVRRTFSIARTWDGIQRLQGILAQADRVQVALDPADSAWRPLAGALLALGLEVYLVDPKTSSRFRKALSAHVKSDKVDAQALARLLMTVPDELDPLHLPPASIVRLRDLVRHRDRLTEEISSRKRRVQSLVGQIQPTLMEALGQDKFLPAYRAFLRKYVDPRSVVRLGNKRLHDFLNRRYRAHHFDPARTEAILEATRSGARLLELQQQGDGLFFEPEQIQLEVSMELDLLEAQEAQIERIEQQISIVYEALDPGRVLQTLPGFGPIISAGVLGETGAVQRFPNVGKYRGFVSLIPRHKATGQSHNERQRLRKAGPRLLKKYLYLAAETARKCDLEMAAFYDRRRRKGHVHDQAVCAVANKLAGRAYAVMKRMAGDDPLPYLFRDLDGHPIPRAEAKSRAPREFPGPVARQRQEASQAKPPSTTEQKEPTEKEARRPRPACTRPPTTDASSSGHSTPRHISEVLSEIGIGPLVGTSNLDSEPPPSS